MRHSPFLPRNTAAAALLGLGALLAGPAQGGQIDPVSAMPAAPPLRLQDTAGQERNLADYRGRAVLVNFWASWCPPCIREMPALRAVSERLAGRGLVVLAVNVQESSAMAERYRRPLGERVRILVDPHGSAFDAWGGQIMPTSYLVDPEGRIRYRAYGDVEWDGEEALGHIERILPADEPEKQKAPPQIGSGS